MFDLLTNITKVALNVAVATPLAIVADVVNMPSDAYDGKEGFSRTKKRLDTVEETISEIVKPLKE